MNELKVLSKLLGDEVNKLRSLIAGSENQNLTSTMTEIEMLCGDITLAVNKQAEQAA